MTTPKKPARKAQPGAKSKIDAAPTRKRTKAPTRTDEMIWEFQARREHWHRRERIEVVSNPIIVSLGRLEQRERAAEVPRRWDRYS